MALALTRYDQAANFIDAVTADAGMLRAVVMATSYHGQEVATLDPSSYAARTWLARHAVSSVSLLLAQSYGPLQGRAILASHLQHTRWCGITVDDGRELKEFPIQPALVVKSMRGLAAAWRLFAPIDPLESIELSSLLAGRLGGRALGHLFPVPGCGGVRLVQHLSGDSFWAHEAELSAAATSTDRPLRRSIDTEYEPEFTDAANVSASDTDWLWPGVFERGTLSLLSGGIGMGKSQVAIYTAATVSIGGTWPDGSQAPLGAACICELEDDPGKVRARLEACGADLYQIRLGSHYDLANGMDRFAAGLESIPDLCLLVLSPILAFWNSGDQSEPAMRAKLRPLLAWAAARRVAVLGIIHPPKTGAPDKVAGSEVFLRASRAAWRIELDATDREPLLKRKRREMVPIRVSNGSTDARLVYRIEDAATPGGVASSRVRFLSEEECTPNIGSRPLAWSVANDLPPVTRIMNTARAKTWLMQVLAYGPVDSGLLRTALEADGYLWDSSEPALYRAADELGISRESQVGTRNKLWHL